MAYHFQLPPGWNCAWRHFLKAAGHTAPDSLLPEEAHPLPLEFFPVQAAKTRRVFHHTLPEAAGYPHSKNKMPHLLQLQ
jgi:hypothetical protein